MPLAEYHCANKAVNQLQEVHCHPMLACPHLVLAPSSAVGRRSRPANIINATQRLMNVVISLSEGRSKGRALLPLDNPAPNDH